MDETVKIYMPNYAKTETASNVQSEIKKNVGSTGNAFIEFVKEYDAENREKIRYLDLKHPLVIPLVRAFSILLGVMLVFSLIGWAINIRTNHIAEAYAATAISDYQAEQDAIAADVAAKAEAERKSLDVIMNSWADDGAKAVYGIRNFIDKYGYSEADIRTYIRCMLDRMDLTESMNGKTKDEVLEYIKNYPGVFHSIVGQEAQFLAYSDNNPVLKEYKDPVLKEIKAYFEESAKPWDSSFRFAELNPDGIFLVQDINSDGYARRVQY